jgi:pre-rRNA-processing protein TSR2
MENHPQAKQAFQEGLESVMRQWTALELAVVNQWGGSSSSEKANQMFSELLDMFYNQSRKLYKDVRNILINQNINGLFVAVL